MKFLKNAFTFITTPLNILLAIANILRTFIFKVFLLIPLVPILLIVKLIKRGKGSVLGFVASFFASDCVSFGHNHHHDHMAHMHHLAHEEHLRNHHLAHNTAMHMHETAHNVAMMNNLHMM